MASARVDEPRRPSLVGRLIAAWRRVRWPVLAVLAAASFILGVIGFAEHLRLTGEPRPLSRLGYLSIQLFVLESGAVAPPTPWTLEVARLAAPAVSVYSAASALAAVFRDELARARLRFSRGHVIVCGLGAKGSLIASGFRAMGHRVVAIELDPGAPTVPEARRSGAIVVFGDATRPEELARARVGRASHLVSVCGDDATDAAVAIEAVRSAETRSRTLHAYVHIVDDDLRRVLQATAIGSGDRRVVVEYFNVYERGARVLLGKIPVVEEGWHRRASPSAVVVGAGRLGEALIVRLARSWRDARGDAGPLRLTVIDREAGGEVAGLIDRHPSLPGSIEVAAHDVDVHSARFRDGSVFDDLGGLEEVDAVFICLGDPALAISAAAGVIDAGPEHLPVAVRLPRRGSLSRLVDSMAGSGRSTAPVVFPLLEETCTPEVLLAGTWETLARAIHEDYVARERRAGETPLTNPSMVPWVDLPERLRASNRDQAADIGSKLAEIGCGLLPDADWEAPLLEVSADEVELLARREHERWMAHCIADGWVYGSGPKDDAARLHPGLVPFDDLPDEIKEADRSAVRGIPAFLARAGFHAHRLEGGRAQRAVSRAEPTSLEPSSS